MKFGLYIEVDECLHDGVPYDPIQGQGQGQSLSPPPFTEGAGKWQLILKLEHNI